MQIRKVISWFSVSAIMTIAVMLLFVRADQNTNKVVDQIDQSIYGITLAGEYSFAVKRYRLTILMYENDWRGNF
ncbi:MAG: hypothetical protein IPK61_05150 [Saprospiraceae bacterium]|nr:hypothetical protein [Saprospiraceae bacterium]